MSIMQPNYPSMSVPLWAIILVVPFLLATGLALPWFYIPLWWGAMFCLGGWLASKFPGRPHD
jgi:hypothetical protein